LFLLIGAVVADVDSVAELKKRLLQRMLLRKRLQMRIPDADRGRGSWLSRGLPGRSNPPLNVSPRRA
jgi:hypothetical protein